MAVRDPVVIQSVTRFAPLEGQLRPAWAEIDLGAIRHNAAVLAAEVHPARLCAVVKAAGYGHGAPEVARAALEGGADWLAVALVEEGRELRAAGIDAPVLVLSEPAPSAMDEVVELSLTPTLYTPAGLDAIRSAVRASRIGRPFSVHIKVDTGMHRVGAPPPAAVALALEAGASPELHLGGFWTHFAVSDEVADPYTSEQVDRFQQALDGLAAGGVRPALRHAANSGGAIWHPDSRFDMVRCGIALYGLSPGADGTSRHPVPLLRPAMAVKARVSFVKTVPAGERLSYGLRYRLARDSVVATVPLGYADGVTRSLSATGGMVLIAGQRVPIAGTVTMDQVLVDCGPDSRVAVGDEVVLLGRQGDEEITAWEWAERTGSIAYEVVCGISGRVPRSYLGA
ncbi:MAG TPA: alanine racemase [Acidimicrobiales bacterium]|nr:alanine racemase [Acidimicrobiales bacterium]